MPTFLDSNVKLGVESKLFANLVFLLFYNFSVPGGPSARSGHRMVQCKKQLIVFGGFHDNTR